MSFAARQDTRFGTGNPAGRHQLEGADGPSGSGHPAGGGAAGPTASGRRHWWSPPAPGPRWPGWRQGLSDTPVTLAAKSLLRVGCPGGAWPSPPTTGWALPGRTSPGCYQRKHYYFVPYGQDDPNAKPQSLKARFRPAARRRWKRPCRASSYSRCCNVRVECKGVFSGRGKMWYTQMMSIRMKICGE